MSDNQNLSSIEMKKKGISASNNKRSDLKELGKSILKNFIYTILFAIVGANTVYIALSDLDKLLPSEPNKLPYSSEPVGKSFIQKGIQQGKEIMKSLYKNRHQIVKRGTELVKQMKNTQFRGGGDASEKMNDIEKRMQIICDGLKETILKTQETSPKFDTFYKQTGFSTVGFPYNYITKDKDGIISVFKNMIGESTKYSYNNGRNLLKTFLKFFSGFGNIGLNVLFVLALPLIAVLVMGNIPLIFGFITTFLSFIGSFLKLMPEKYGWFLTILIIFFLGIVVLSLDMFWAFAVGITQMVRLIATFLFLPILIDTKNVLKIIACKSYIILPVFVVLTIVTLVIFFK